MADAQRNLTPSAIKYLLTLLELCQKDAGARSAACAVLAQMPDAVPQMMERLSRRK